MKGYMVGNGATNWNFDVEPSFPQTLRWFNVITPKLLAQYEAADCHYYFYEGFHSQQNSAECDALWAEINYQSKDLNWYDLYRPVYPESILGAQEELRANRYGTTIIDGEPRTYKRGMTMQEYTPFARHLKAF